MFQTEDDARAFIVQGLQDFLATLPLAARQATAPAINAALRIAFPPPQGAAAPALPPDSKGSC